MRPVVLLIAALLVLPMVWAPAAPASEHPDATPVPGLEGPRATLRLYGCSDVTVPGPDAMIRPSGAADASPFETDGRMDCEGDRLVLTHGWFDPARDSFHRAALGPRSESMVVTAQYHPTLWFPGPGHDGGIADPVDPARGLFDVDADGHFDPAWHLVPPPDGGAAQPADRHPPRDRLPDRFDRHDGSNADLYHPGLEVAYHVGWADTAGRALPVPSGASFLFPAASWGSSPGLDSASPQQADPVAVQWQGRPFGLGTGNDAIGALVTPPLILGDGEAARFLDHAVKVDGFFGTPDAPRVALDLSWLGGAEPESVSRGQVVHASPGDTERHATLTYLPQDATNVLFVDRTGVSTSGPNLTHPEAPDADDAWFVLVRSIDHPAGGPPSVEVRLGRLVAERAPLNALVVDSVLYHIRAVDERGSDLHRLTVSSLLPLGADVRLPHTGVTLQGVGTTGPFPLIPPFQGTHFATKDLEPQLARDANGFLAGATDDTDITSRDLAFHPAAATAAERSEQQGPLRFRWQERGVEERFTVPMVGLASDRHLTDSRMLPAEYVTLVLPDGRYRVDSVLLDDTGSLTGASAAPLSPRGFRSFVFDPQDPDPLFIDDEGLRLFGVTAARPAAGERVLIDPALIRGEHHPGGVRVADTLVHQVVSPAVAFDPYHPFTVGATPVRAESGNVTDQGPDQDNLWDAEAERRAGETIYGPALLIDHHHAFVDRTAFEQVTPPLGERTALLLPAADRDPSRPGLDSADLDGDGRLDETVLRGFWDLAADAPGQFRSSGRFVPEGNASTADLLWLRSAPLHLAVGGSAQFFDFGVRFDGSQADGDTLQGRFVLTDHVTSLERDLATVDRADPDGSACLVIRFDGTAATEPRDCDGLRVSAPAAGAAPRDVDDLWWVEVQAVGTDAATVVLNRMVTPVDRPAVGDQSAMYASGQMYRWADIQIGSQGSSTDRFQGIVLRQVVPIGSDLSVPRGDGSLIVVRGTPFGGSAPILWPFSARHENLQLHALAVETSSLGLLDGRAGPSDQDAVVVARPDRTKMFDPLRLIPRDLGIEGHHRFVSIDPARLLDPGRTGSAFVNGMHAVPWSGAPMPSGTERLQTEGTDGFREALQTHRDRGWDHYVVLDITGRDRVVVDSARLGRADLTAKVLDEGAGTAGGSVDLGLHPQDPGMVPFAARASGLWVVPLTDRSDLYVGTIPAPPVVEPPGPSPSPLPEHSPPVSPPGPNGTDGPPEPEGSPSVGAIVVLAMLAALLWSARRRH